jgi:hypothetical protein
MCANVVDNRTGSPTLGKNAVVNQTEVAAANWLNATRTLTSISGLTANSNLVSIDGQLTAGHNATLNLKRLSIVNSGASALEVISDTVGMYVQGSTYGLDIAAMSYSSYAGLHIAANGTGDGVLVEAGGRGVVVVATAGVGFLVQAGSHGMHIKSGATAPGFNDAIRLDTVTGGSVGYGLNVLGYSGGVKIDGASGHGVDITGITYGLYCTGIDNDGGGNAAAFIGQGNGSGIIATGTGTGNGALITSQTGAAVTMASLSSPGLYISTASVNPSVAAVYISAMNEVLGGKGVHIDASDDAVFLNSRSSRGMLINGFTSGLHITANQNALWAESASAIGILASGSTFGFKCQGNNAGVYATGPIGMYISGTNGNAITAQSSGGDGHGIQATASGTGDGLNISSPDGLGVRIVSTTAGGFYVSGASYGMLLAGTAGDGLTALSSGGDGNGIYAYGNGNGSGMALRKGSAMGTGHDLTFQTPDCTVPVVTDVTNTVSADVVEIDSVAYPAQELAISAATMASGLVDDTVFTPTTTEFQTGSITDAAVDYYKTRTLIFADGVTGLAKQARSITGYSLVGGQGHFTVKPLTQAPNNGDRFIIV